MVLTLKVLVSNQELLVCEDNSVCERFPISTARNGLGELQGSFCTPQGWHIVRAKIGAGYPLNTIFVDRRPVGGLYSPELRMIFPKQTWILTRILWLSGTEIGKNRLREVDTMRRYIYIHGAPDDAINGIPNSKGCIVMKNKDIIRLFDWVVVGTRVNIQA